MHKISETDLHLLTVNLRKKFNEGYQLDEYSLNQFGLDADSAFRGAANGLTFGTADNIAAAADTGVGKLGKALGQNWGASDYKTNLQNQQAQTAYAKNKSSRTPSWQGYDSVPDWVPLIGKGEHNINMYDVGDFTGSLGGGYALASKVGSALTRTAAKSALKKAGVDTTKGVAKYAVPTVAVAGDVSAQLGAGEAAGVGKEALDKALSGMAQWQVDKLMSYPPSKIQLLQQNLNLRYGANIPVTGKIDAELINTLVNNKIAIYENKKNGENFMKTKSQIILENKVKSLKKTIMKVSEAQVKLKAPEPHVDPHDPHFSASHDVHGTTSIDDLMNEPTASDARAASLAQVNAELEQKIAAAKAAKAIGPKEQAELDKLERLKGEERKQYVLDLIKWIAINPTKATVTFTGLLLLYYTVTTGRRAASIADAIANQNLDTIDPKKAVPPAPSSAPSPALTSAPSPAPSSAPSPAPSSGPKEGDKDYSKSGKPVIFRNGGWEYL